MELDRYAVKPEDTLASISSSHHMKIADLCNLNQITGDGDIFPGMVITIHKYNSNALPFEELEDQTNNSDAPILQRHTTIEQFSIDSRNDFTLEVTYCTADGDVVGELGVSYEKIVFCPYSENDRCIVTANTQKYTVPIFQFRLCIAIRDLTSCSILELPSLNALNPEDKFKNFFIQFLITRTGKEKKEIDTNIPKANVYFKLSDKGPKGQLSYFEQKVNADELAGLIKARQEQQRLSPSSEWKTFVPYFDFNRSYQQYVETGLKESNLEDEEEKYQDLNIEIEEYTLVTRRSIRFSLMLDEEDILPQLSQASEILSDAKIMQITKNMGMLFQIRNWQLAYSFTVHGTSLEVFFRSLEDAGPSVLVIEDTDHHIFGGFASHQWKPCKFFYGTGDCFLYTFHDTKKIQCYFPTLLNDFYMSSDQDGITMGGGGQAGLLIDRNFVYGASGRSQTYANEILSGRDHFNLLKLEFWAMV